jgi:hypothetical protein
MQYFATGSSSISVGITVALCIILSCIPAWTARGCHIFILAYVHDSLKLLLATENCTHYMNRHKLFKGTRYAIRSNKITYIGFKQELVELLVIFFVLGWSKNTSLRTTLFWVITHWVVTISYQHFGTTYQSHLQGSRIPLDPLRWGQ